MCVFRACCELLSRLSLGSLSTADCVRCQVRPTNVTADDKAFIDRKLLALKRRVWFETRGFGPFDDDEDDDDGFPFD